MKLLFLTTHPPDAPTDGIKIVSFHLIRFLKENYNYDIDLVSITLEKEMPDMSGIAPYCKTIKTFQIKKQTSHEHMKKLYRHTPNQIVKYYDAKVHRAFRNYIKGKDYQLIYVMPLEVWQYVNDIKSIPRIMHPLDANSLREILQFIKESFISYRKYYSIIRYLKMMQYEKKHFPHADRCVVVSEHDRDYMMKHGNQAAFSVIPNGVDGNYFDPEKVASFSKKPNLVFTGDFQYRPNELAALDLYKKVYLLLKKDYPNLELYLVGKNPTKAMRKVIVDSGAMVTGFVDDIRPYMKSATVFVCPLKFGAGMKNKILEMMAMQAPVVCSRFSVYGLDALEENGLLKIAEQERDYSDHIKGLLNDKLARQELGLRGRKYVLEKFTWEKAGDQVNTLISELVKNK